MAGFGSDELQSFPQLGFELGLQIGILLILQLGTPVKLNIFFSFPLLYSYISMFFVLLEMAVTLAKP